jgi:hypothetical protein
MMDNRGKREKNGGFEMTDENRKEVGREIVGFGRIRT